MLLWVRQNLDAAQQDVVVPVPIANNVGGSSKGRRKRGPLRDQPPARPVLEKPRIVALSSIALEVEARAPALRAAPLPPIALRFRAVALEVEPGSAPSVRPAARAQVSVVVEAKRPEPIRSVNLLRVDLDSTVGTASIVVAPLPAVEVGLSAIEAAFEVGAVAFRRSKRWTLVPRARVAAVASRAVMVSSVKMRGSRAA